ncbi:hypothetical protein KCU81_g9785, partial [Aureobasidium melanogenum]|uniref:NAD(P)-binding protein n=1 Tax=Aureobasidium melanogenum (strain CBS 110374) TaxID=1043003 RepID=A0A074VWQ2_AURM1
MVKLTTVTAANVAFIKKQSLTAVFVGATNGIGEFTVRELCKTHGHEGPSLRIIIVGRNEKAAQQIMTECKFLCSSVDFHFVQGGDISLLHSVDKSCDEIRSILETTKTTSIDMLVMTQGKVEFGPRIDTKEGLDKSMSLLYYSRMRFIDNLIPSLLCSTLHTGARIISIYAGGAETMGTLYSSDLSLDQFKHYSFANCRTHSVAMKTMYLEDLADKHAGKLSCSHMYPGLVVHKGFDDPNYPLWFKIIWRIVKPFTRFFPMYLTPEDIGQRVLFLASGQRYAPKGSEIDAETVDATDGVKGGGAYSVTYTNEINDVSKFYQNLRVQNFKEAVLQHTEDVFRAIERDGVFQPSKAG